MILYPLLSTSNEKFRLDTLNNETQLQVTRDKYADRILAGGFP